MGIRVPSRGDNIIFMGDSAGAGLALGVAHHLNREERPLPQQIILLGPWLDITMSNPDILPVDKYDPLLGIKGLQMAGAVYAGSLDPRDDKVSPLYGDFEGLPPISVFVGTHDLFVADCRRLKEKMRSAQLPLNYFEYTKMMHVWVADVVQREAIHAMEQIAKLIGR